MPLLDYVDDGLIVEAILQIVEKHNHYREHQYCGLILEKRNPSTNKSIIHLLSRISFTWSKSVEQFPFWVEKQFGMAKVRDAIQKLENECTSAIMKDNLDTMKWWLKI